MNTVFIIGNGFDINLGMNTSFKDFLKYYLTIERDNDLIKELKKDISKDIDNWADLELAIGRYTDKLNTLDEFDRVFEDILDSLTEYLKNVEASFEYKDGEKLLKYLSAPENSLPPLDKAALNNYKSKWGSHQWNTSIITFNYTMSCEKLLGFTGKKIPINNHHGTYSNNLNRIEHIHGLVNNRMIMGVNDISQIANKSFRDNTDILEALVKSRCNKAHKEMIEELCKNIIQQAHLICIFGSSIGDTDNMWWELIGNLLKNECRLIIFHKGEDYPLNKNYKRPRDERRLKTAFLNKTKLKQEEKDSAFSKIFIAVNSDMFDIGYGNMIKEEVLIAT